MKQTYKPLIVGLGVALVLALGLTAGWAAGTAKARPTSTATVDLQKVVDNLEQRRQAEADLRTRQEKLEAEARDKRKQIDDLQNDLKTLATPGTAGFEQKQEELYKKLAEFDAWNRIATQRLANERNVQLDKIYKDVMDAIGRLAKENGIDVVMVKQVNLNLPTGRPEQPTITVPIRGVLYCVEELDVTDQVIQRMNNDFRNMMGKKPN